VFELGNTIEKATALVEAGEADYLTQQIASQSASRVASRYGPGSAADKQGRQRFFSNPSLGLSFFVLNQRRPLFRDLRLRQAVNYALDRRALARLGNVLSPYPNLPTDQYIPPGIPGFRDARIYPFSPDVATARRLAGGKRRSAVLYVGDKRPFDRLAQVVKANLGAIGIDVQVKVVPFPGAYFTRLPRKNEPYDLAWYPWLADYPDPDQFLDVLMLSGGTFPPLEDPVTVRKLEAAARLSGPPRYLRYGKLDADLARNAAPFAAVGNFATPDFFSARIGCQVYHPVYGMDLAALCIRKKS
jgi:peptide/nickel transport system substrate-binding protein